MLYSDALTESPNKEGERLEEDGFSKLAEPFIKDKKLNVNGVVDSVINKFFDFASKPPPDDVTVVYLERKD